jgi:hypothetical protein
VRRSRISSYGLALAALRIVLALLVLGDLTSRASDLHAHYTGEGVLPRAALLEHEEVLSPLAFSLNLMNGQAFPKRCCSLPPRWRPWDCSSAIAHA